MIELVPAKCRINITRRKIKIIEELEQEDSKTFFRKLFKH